MGPATPCPIRESTNRVGPKGTQALPDAAVAEWVGWTKVAPMLTANATKMMAKRRDILPRRMGRRSLRPIPRAVKERMPICSAPCAGTPRERRDSGRQGMKLDLLTEDGPG